MNWLIDRARRWWGRIRARLIADLRHAWRMWSVRLNAIGLAVLAWVQIDPVSVLEVWNMMPAAVRAHLPAHFVLPVASGLFALSLLARLVRQPKLEKKRNG
ncbi:MAG: hypothetical protein AB7G24_00720 [Novosphingobium sp.]